LIWFEYKYYLILFVIHGLLPEINIFFRVIRLFYKVIISIIYTNDDPVSISIQKRAPVCVTKSAHETQLQWTRNKFSSKKGEKQTISVCLQWPKNFQFDATHFPTASELSSFSDLFFVCGSEFTLECICHLATAQLNACCCRRER